jgi:hypothetical protein
MNHEVYCYGRQRQNLEESLDDADELAWAECPVDMFLFIAGLVVASFCCARLMLVCGRYCMVVRIRCADMGI